MSDRETQGESRPRGLLGGTFTRENAAVGWSSIWHGLVIGAPLTALFFWVAGLSKYNLLILAVVWIPIRWSWRQLGGHSPVARVFLTILLTAWVLIPPLNYSFNLSCRRAVRMHRGIEVGPLFYLFGWVAFAIVWAATWLATGWPLSKFFEIVGDPETWTTWKWIVFFIWPLFTLAVLIPIYGRLISAMADRYGSPAGSGASTA